MAKGRTKVRNHPRLQAGNGEFFQHEHSSGMLFTAKFLGFAVLKGKSEFCRHRTCGYRPCLVRTRETKCNHKGCTPKHCDYAVRKEKEVSKYNWSKKQIQDYVDSIRKECKEHRKCKKVEKPKCKRISYKLTKLGDHEILSDPEYDAPYGVIEGKFACADNGVQWEYCYGEIRFMLDLKTLKPIKGDWKMDSNGNLSLDKQYQLDPFRINNLDEVLANIGLVV